jgi:hypothetical protein
MLICRPISWNTKLTCDYLKEIILEGPEVLYVDLPHNHFDQTAKIVGIVTIRTFREPSLISRQLKNICLLVTTTLVIGTAMHTVVALTLCVGLFIQTAQCVLSITMPNTHEVLVDSRISEDLRYA